MRMRRMHTQAPGLWRITGAVCMFITVGPITKLCAGRSMGKRYYSMVDTCDALFYYC